MGDYFDWWWGGGSWYDRKQQEQMASLHATQTRATSRLRSKLREEAKRSQDLATRLSKLEDAVIASIELEDLRGMMDNFSDAAATRQYARDVLARIPALGRVASTQNPQVPPDVPDYWLHPAVRAVAAGLDGDAATERTAADEARRRDPARTAQFFAAVAILRGTAVADDDLATLWPTSRQVSQYQRSLWLAVAGGGLGEEARTSLVNALTWAVGRDADVEPAEDDALRLVRVAQRSSSPPQVPLDEVVVSAMLGRRKPTDPAGAAEALSTLREAVAAAMAGADTTSTTGEVPDGVADLLAQVVSAGAPAEEPLVARIIELRGALAAIGATTAIATPSMLDDASLDVVELLRADLGPGADPGAKAVAVRALAEPIDRVAAGLADVAAQELPDGADVRVGSGVTVAVTSLGPVDTDWRRRLAERMKAQMPSSGPNVGQMVGGGVAAILGIVLGIVAAPGWFVLAVAGGALAGYGYWQLNRARRDAEQRMSTAVADADAAISARASELAGAIAISRGRQAAVPDELAQVRAALATD
ncbi:hypothetical protein [Pseudactinotalea sp.]|uniref:hypothetical protein n=1 Tax=Pseudactinotalea sp. TaxID=1926260 RepID=UPI003B3A8218